MNLDYIAVCIECGATVGWHSGKGGAGQAAKSVGYWMRQGLDIQRCDTATAKAKDWGHKPDCKHFTPRQKELL